MSDDQEFTPDSIIGATDWAEEEKQRKLSEARARSAKVESKDEPWPIYLARNVTMGGNIGLNLKMSRAKSRIDAGKATDQDYEDYAWAERVKQFETEQHSTVGGTLGAAAMRAPEFIGQVAAAGPIVGGIGKAIGLGGAMGVLGETALAGGVRGIGARALLEAAKTPFVPNLYLERAMSANMEKGREPYDPRGLPAPMAMGALQMAALGAVGQWTQNVIPGKGALPAAGRLGMMGTAGPIANMATQVTGGLLNLETGYGTLGMLREGKTDEAVRHVVSDAAMFLMFGAYHEISTGGGVQRPGTGFALPEGPQPEAAGQFKVRMSEQTELAGKAISGYLNDQSRRGRPVSYALGQLEAVNQRIREAFKGNPSLTREEAKSLFPEKGEGRLRDYVRVITDAFPSGEQKQLGYTPEPPGGRKPTPYEGSPEVPVLAGELPYRPGAPIMTRQTGPVIQGEGFTMDNPFPPPPEPPPGRPPAAPPGPVAPPAAPEPAPAPPKPATGQPELAISAQAAYDQAKRTGASESRALGMARKSSGMPDWQPTKHPVVETLPPETPKPEQPAAQQAEQVTAPPEVPRGTSAMEAALESVSMEIPGVKEAYASLTDNQKLVVQHAVSQLTEKQSAGKLGVAKQRVSQISQDIMNKFGRPGESLFKVFKKRAADVGEPVRQGEVELEGLQKPGRPEPEAWRVQTRQQSEQAAFESLNARAKAVADRLAEQGLTQEQIRNHPDTLAVFAEYDAAVKATNRAEQSQYIAAKKAGKLDPESGALDLDVIAEGAKKFFRWAFSNRAAGLEPPIRIDPSRIIPELQNATERKAIASTPRGIALAGGLGKILDNRANAVQPDQQAVLAYRGAGYSGETIAKIKGNQLEQVYGKDLPPVGPDGFFTGTNGKKLAPEDVVKAEILNPGSQPIPDGLRRFIHNAWEPMRIEMIKDRRARGMTEDVAHFPRPAVGLRKPPPGMAEADYRPYLERKYATEAEGITSEHGVIYEPSWVERVKTAIEGHFRAQGAHDLATDKSLGGKTAQERFEDMKAARSDLTTLPKETRKLVLDEMRRQSQIPDWQWERISAGPADLQAQFFPPAVAARLQSALGEQSNAFLRNMSKAADVMKGAVLGLDASVPFVQGLPVMASNPRAWGKATAGFFEALGSPERLKAHLAQPENVQAAMELAMSGTRLGQLQDYGMQLEKGGALANVPGYKQAGRATGAFFDLARIEMWKAFKAAGGKPADYAKMAEVIDNLTGMGRMEQVGISPARANMERLLFNAPAYYRSAVNLMAMAFQRNVAGNMAFKALGLMTGGVAMVTFGLMKAVGLNKDEILDRFNPASGKYMTVPIPVGGDKKIEAGFSNVFRSMARLAGDSIELVFSDKPIGDATQHNPWMRWLVGHTGQLPGLAFQLASEQDYLGRPQPAHVAFLKHVTPLWTHDLLGPESTPNQKVGDVLFSMIGFQAYSQSAYDEYKGHAAARSQKMFNLPWTNLTLPERARVLSSLEREGIEKAEGGLREKIMAQTNAEARREKVGRMLSLDSQETLAELGERVSPYTNTMRVGGQDVPLTEPESKRYEVLLKESYDQMIGKLDAAALKNAAPMARKARVDAVMNAARNLARAKLLRELLKRPAP